MYNSFTNVSTVGSRELWGTWQEQTGVGKEKMLGHLWACGRPSSAGPRDLQTPTPTPPPHRLSSSERGGLSSFAGEKAALPHTPVLGV